MKFYRVCQKQYSPGDRVWENIFNPPKPSKQHNLALFRSLIASGDQNALNNAMSLPDDLRIASSEAAKEAALEIIREAEFPGLPSRLSSLMAFASKKDLEKFRSVYRPAETEYYILEYPDELQTHHADMKTIDDLADIFISSLLEMARRYWSGVATGDPLWETILASDNSVVLSRENFI